MILTEINIGIENADMYE